MAIKLETKRLVLRDLQMGDEASLQENINNLNISKWLLVVPFPYGKADAEQFVGKCIMEQQKSPRENCEFGITLKGEDKIIGGFGITKINYFDGAAAIGYWLAEKYWRHGLMFEAASQGLEFAFNELGLRRINVEVYTENIASNTLIKKLGFRLEGNRKQVHRTKSTGQLRDDYIYGLLKEEWAKNRAK